MPKTSAFGYMRCSGQGQVDGDTWARQSKAIKSYAAAHGIKLVKTFKEEAVSGTIEGMNRPEWAETLVRILANGVKVIVVESLNRVARVLMVQERIIEDLREHGITLISTMEPDLMADDPTRIAMRQVMGVFSQYEKSQLVIKLRAARERKRAAGGRCEGRKAFGSKPGEDKTVKRMQALRADGHSFDVIAARLNAEGKPTGNVNREGQPTLWYGTTVINVLKRNPVNTVEADVVQALVGFGATRKDAMAAVARVRRDGDTFDSLFRRASVAR